MIKKILLLTVFLSCTTVQPVVVVAPIKLTSEQEWEQAKHEQDVAWDKEVQQKTFDELVRDIKADWLLINKVGKCIENEDKTWYDCTKI